MLINRRNLTLAGFSLLIGFLVTLFTFQALALDKNRKGIGDMVAIANESIVSLISQRDSSNGVNLDSILRLDDDEGYLSDEYGKRSGNRNVFLCSGTFMTESGAVITSEHCISNTVSTQVRTFDGRVYRARVVFRDSKTDLAILMVDGKGRKFKPISVGSSDNIRPGDNVITIGNPDGFHQTVTRGIISSKHRKIGMFKYEDHIQTDAAINPGASGGALLDADGRMIGVICAMSTRNQNMGFVVPSEFVVSSVRSLSLWGKMRYGFFGIAVKSIRTLAKDTTTPECMKQHVGVVVKAVHPKGPSIGKIEPGDIILSIGGRKMYSTSQIGSMAVYNLPGFKTEVKLIRNCKELTVELVPMAL